MAPSSTTSAAGTPASARPFPLRTGAAPVLPLDGWRFPPGAPEQHARNDTIRAYDPDAAERQPLTPASVEAEVVWVQRAGAPAGRGARLLDAIKATTLPERDRDGPPPELWFAGEALAVRGLREHLRGERGLPIGPMQAIGYWQHRDTPDDVEDDES
ncbi:hypothetical protein DSM104299_03779 [Baekduia alba]|uniref:SIP domain-containing protein n=1 Tax=Baekduia alba TaxID=2997333 RepID=UPI0023401C47|nr:SIP domain-containing protein [Baekduia alba]WCB95037.1 hypothetical protein DSM104299_03779 [Baekduia alba]